MPCAHRELQPSVPPTTLDFSQCVQAHMRATCHFQSMIAQRDLVDAVNAVANSVDEVDSTIQQSGGVPRRVHKGVQDVCGRGGAVLQLHLRIHRREVIVHPRPACASCRTVPFLSIRHKGCPFPLTLGARVRVLRTQLPPRHPASGAALRRAVARHHFVPWQPEESRPRHQLCRPRRPRRLAGLAGVAGFSGFAGLATNTRPHAVAHCALARVDRRDALHWPSLFPCNCLTRCLMRGSRSSR